MGDTRADLLAGRHAKFGHVVGVLTEWYNGVLATKRATIPTDSLVRWLID